MRAPARPARPRAPRPRAGPRPARPARARRRVRQGRPGHRRRCSRSASGSSRSARSPPRPSPATRGRACSGCRATARSINRMGFNNDGAAAAARRLAHRGAGTVGVNIGKTKRVAGGRARSPTSPTARSALAPLADYLVVNVSSPNTPGLRDLQAVDKLRPLLVAVRAACDLASPTAPRPAAGQDRARPRRRRHRRGRRPRARARARRHHRDQHHDRAHRPGDAGRRGRRARRRRPVRRAAPGRARSTVLRRLRARAGDRLDADRGRRHRDRRRRVGSGSAPARRWCRPTPASSTAARCGRAGSTRARRQGPRRAPGLDRAGDRQRSVILLQSGRPWPSARSPRSGTPCCARSRARSARDELARPETQRFIDDLVETMRDADGAGLAAIQVYEPIRDLRDRGPQQPALSVQAADPADDPRQPGAHAGRRREFDNYEGCLSVPNLRGVVKRARPRARPARGTATATRSTRSSTASRPAPTSTRSITSRQAVRRPRHDPRTFATWTEFDRHHKARVRRAGHPARRPGRLVGATPGPAPRPRFLALPACSHPRRWGLLRRWRASAAHANPRTAATTPSPPPRASAPAATGRSRTSR